MLMSKIMKDHLIRHYMDTKKQDKGLGEISKKYAFIYFLKL